MTKKALVSGSFDPVTVGHLDLIKRASEIFDTVYVVAFANTEKKYLFEAEERKKLLELACEGITNVIIDLYDGLLADYTEKNGIQTIIRGVRDPLDTSYEIMLSTINRGLGNSPDTVLLPTKAEYSHISSSYVRDMIKYRQSLYGIVPDNTVEYILSISTKKPLIR